MECLGDGIDGSDADTAADADHGSELFDVARLPQGTDHVEDYLAQLKAGELFRGRAHFLEDHRYLPLFPVKIGNRERYALCPLVGPQHDELARFYPLGYLRHIELPHHQGRRQLAFLDYLVYAGSYFAQFQCFRHILSSFIDDLVPATLPGPFPGEA